MEKFIGNKRKLCPNIAGLLEEKEVDGNKFCDIFSGTTNVSQHFKELGFTIICNDILDMSFVFGKAYIENNSYPKFNKLFQNVEISEKVSEGKCIDLIKLNSNGSKFSIEDFKETKKYRLLQVLTYLTFIASSNDYPKDYISFIHRNYCERGKNSKYWDKINKTWKRRLFFSEEHGKRIDIILNTLKYWKEKDYLKENEFYILLSTLIDAVALFSNTSGVYEAFYKKLFPNTQQIFRLTIPKLIESNKKHFVFKEDSNNLIKKLPEFDILYIDPPYNTRQYSSNYHLLNLIAKFHEIKDLKSYEKELVGARGQNLKENFKSKYCSRDTFEEVMRDLIENAKCKFVIVSYFDGDDNLWKEKGNKTGIRIISEILKNPKIFKPTSFDLMRVSRQNFQSKRDLKKKIVNELLFYAEKKDF
jgi:adenine-specific DNA-methyltransferase